MRQALTDLVRGDLDVIEGVGAGPEPEADTEIAERSADDRAVISGHLRRLSKPPERVEYIEPCLTSA